MTIPADTNVLRSLGMRLVDAPPGTDLAMTMPVRPGVTNSSGGLQGGLIATLVDVVAGTLAYNLAGEGAAVPTADLHVRFLAPVTLGPAHAAARLLRRGKSLIVIQVDVRDGGRDVLAAFATIAFSVRTARPGQEVHTMITR